MSTKIRLARFGRNKTPFYHVVVTDSRNRRDSNFIEKIGFYNPLLADDNKEKLKINKDRAEYWLSVGAQPTERAAILMIKLGINGAEKYKPVFVPKEKKVEAKTENVAAEPVVEPAVEPEVESAAQ